MNGLTFCIGGGVEMSFAIGSWIGVLISALVFGEVYDLTIILALSLTALGLLMELTK